MTKATTIPPRPNVVTIASKTFTPDLAYCDAETGDSVAKFILPLQAITTQTRWLPSCKVRGAYIKNAPDYWVKKHAITEQYFRKFER